MVATAKASATPTPAGPLSGQVAVYGASNAVVAAVNFALLPIYARVLEPADYGAMSLIVTVCSAVSMLGMMGMSNAVQRFFFDEKDAAAQQRIWSSGFLGGVGLTAAAAVLAGVVCAALASSQPALAGWPVVLALAAMVPQAIVAWLQDQARLQFRPLRFAAIAVSQALVAGGAGILLVAVWQRGLVGFFAAALLAASMTAAAAIFTARSFWPLTFSRPEFVRLIKFGAPFVPAGAFIWLSIAFLRWVLADSRSLAEAGLFDVAWKLAAPVWMLNVAVGQAFGPFAFRERAGNPAYRARLIEAFHVIAVATLCTTMVVALFAHELCVWIAPPAYASAAGPCAILVLAFFFSATHQVTALGIAFAEKSQLIAVGWTAAALGSVALGRWLVPALGAEGAAWCVVIVYAGLSVFYAGCTQRLHPLPFRAGPVVLYLAIGMMTVGLALWAQTREIAVAIVGIKVLWLAAASAVLFAWGGVRPGRLVELVAALPGFARRGS